MPGQEPDRRPVTPRTADPHSGGPGTSELDEFLRDRKAARRTSLAEAEEAQRDPAVETLDEHPFPGLAAIDERRQRSGRAARRLERALALLIGIAVVVWFAGGFR